ncbi:hypothetical protein [Nocardia farcinica]|uniref:hypothetical protein n=1 Tax=Nocardia farcinica TaxID=37329 RepID=UPI002455998C|nr:hypothetical protein [Nocardia farcinica]
MGEVAAFADLLPPWLLILIAGLAGLNYLGQALAASSEQWARVLGPLGRRWRSKAQRRAEQEAADLSSLRRQVGNLAKEVNRLTRRDEQRSAAEARLRDYLVYDADWHWRTRLWAVESGNTLPEHLSFGQWEATPNPPPDEP